MGDGWAGSPYLEHISSPEAQLILGRRVEVVLRDRLHAAAVDSRSRVASGTVRGLEDGWMVRMRSPTSTRRQSGGKRCRRRAANKRLWQAVDDALAFQLSAQTLAESRRSRFPLFASKHAQGYDEMAALPVDEMRTGMVRSVRATVLRARTTDWRFLAASSQSP